MQANSDPLLSIVVISYNTREMTLACLRSVFARTRTTEFEVIVLDNASTDGSPDAITEEFGDQLRLVTSPTNLGFAAGNNAATAYAKGEYLLLLNPDTLILDAAIDRLLEYARRYPEAKIWGGRTLFGNRRLNPGSCWSRQTLWSLLSQAAGWSSLFRRSTLFNPEGIGAWSREGSRAVDIVSGCFLLLERELWLALDGFKEEFFMYGEDADLCLRAAHLGARPRVTGFATIVHYGGASETVQADKLVRLLTAKTLLIHRHFSQPRLGVLLLMGWPLTRYWCHRLLRAMGRKASGPRAQIWGSVWARRQDWLGIQPHQKSRPATGGLRS